MSGETRECPYCGATISYNKLRDHLPCSAVDGNQTTLEVTTDAR